MVETFLMTSFTIREALVAKVTIANLVLALTAYVAFRILYQIVYYRYFHPLSIFPGPFWATTTRLWIAYHDFNSTELSTTYEMHKKYGKWKWRESSSLDVY